ncbi:MAG: type II/IV secretion system protein, partial [Gammaproteobacteria bacterium]|nr:type II/IV secretion system protein [Gammaproteobacteria bacterium]
DISERRIPQDGHAQMKRGQKSVDLRVSVIPVMHGESVVIRILDRDQGLRPFDETGFSRKERMQIRRSLKHSSG